MTIDPDHPLTRARDRMRAGESEGSVSWNDGYVFRWFTDAGGVVRGRLEVPAVVVHLVDEDLVVDVYQPSDFGFIDWLTGPNAGTRCLVPEQGRPVEDPIH